MIFLCSLDNNNVHAQVYDTLFRDYNRKRTLDNNNPIGITNITVTVFNTFGTTFKFRGQRHFASTVFQKFCC